jgi:cytosine/uracil/thiamine/allantoin permease
MNDNYIEWIGYIASFLVAVSFIFKKVEYLRLFNTVGCITFVVYGYYIDSYPVMMANIFILLMNIYHLNREKEAVVSKAD